MLKLEGQKSLEREYQGALLSTLLLSLLSTVGQNWTQKLKDKASFSPKRTQSHLESRDSLWNTVSSFRSSGRILLLIIQQTFSEPCSLGVILQDKKEKKKQTRKKSVKMSSSLKKLLEA